MSFGENLRIIRKQKGLSQEELAELLDVSRQSVSKWEQDQGYPESEKLIALSRKLNVSLDELLETGVTSVSPTPNARSTGTITITSPNENVITECYKVASSCRMPGKKDEPQYALGSVARGINSYWGEPTTFLGWYADEESISREIRAIQDAMIRGDSHYTLQYSVKTVRKGLKIKITSQENIP